MTPSRVAARKASGGARLAAFGVAVLCLALLVTAACISPDRHGHGTHTQLGLPPCGWAMVMGKPCPTCGMTTSFAFAVRGQISESLVSQPFGTLLALFAAMIFWIALHTAALGSMLGQVALGYLTPRVAWLLAFLMLAAWFYKWVTWPVA